MTLRRLARRLLRRTSPVAARIQQYVDASMPGVVALYGRDGQIVGWMRARP